MRLWGLLIIPYPSATEKTGIHMVISSEMRPMVIFLRNHRLECASKNPAKNPAESITTTQRNLLEKPSETGGHTDWVQGWEVSRIHRSSQVFTRFSQVFTGLHRSSQVFTGFHRFSQVFTGLHRFSQVFTGFRRFSGYRSSQVFTGLHRSSQVFTGFHGFHRFSQVFTGLHRFSQVFTGFHRFSQVFTGFHRFSQVFTGFSQVFTGFHRFSKDIQKY